MRWLIPLFILFLIACGKTDPSIASAAQVAVLNSSDGFLRKIPPYFTDNDSIEFKRYLSYNKELGLHSLNNGYDSVEIRMFYGGPMMQDRVICLFNKNKKWVAEVSYIQQIKNPGFKPDPEIEAKRIYPDGYLEKQYINKRTAELRVPRSGWNSFIAKLFKLNVLTLPDETEVKEIKYGLVSDGWGVNVEIATKNYYRLYGYDNPDAQEGVKEAENICRIIKFVEKELGLEDFLQQKHEDVQKLKNLVE